MYIPPPECQNHHLLQKQFPVHEKKLAINFRVVNFFSLLRQRVPLLGNPWQLYLTEWGDK